MKRFIIAKIRRYGYSLLLLTLVMLTIAFVSGTMYKLEESTAKYDEEELKYRIEEDEYVSQVIEILNKNGFENAGVMLTRRACVEDARAYTLAVHHSKLKNLSDKDLEEVLKDCNLDIEKKDLIIEID